MFYECSDLVSLPDISNWSTQNITNMKQIFSGCFNLKNIPNLKK